MMKWLVGEKILYFTFSLAYKLQSSQKLYSKSFIYIIVSFKIESNKEVRAGSQVLNVDVF